VPPITIFDAPFAKATAAVVKARKTSMIATAPERLRPLAIEKMPLFEPPPRGSRFGSPLVLSRVHWVRPEMVVEVFVVLKAQCRTNCGSR